MTKRDKKELRDAYACHNNWFMGGKTESGEDKPGCLNYIMGTVLLIWLIKFWMNYPNV